MEALSSVSVQTAKPLPLTASHSSGHANTALAIVWRNAVTVRCAEWGLFLRISIPTRESRCRLSISHLTTATRGHGGLPVCPGSLVPKITIAGKVSMPSSKLPSQEKIQKVNCRRRKSINSQKCRLLPSVTWQFH